MPLDALAEGARQWHSSAFGYFERMTTRDRDADDEWAQMRAQDEARGEEDEARGDEDEPPRREDDSSDEPREGECTRHARACGNGLGIFALVHQGICLLVDGPRSSFYPSLYLDAHGEEDHGLRRGKPLYLDAQRVASIHRLWLSQTIPLEVARSRASAAHTVNRLGHF